MAGPYATPYAPEGRWQSQHTGTLADLYRRNADVQADAVRRSGEIRGQMATNLGNVAAGTLRDLLKYRQEAPQRAAEAQRQQQETQIRQGTLDAQQRQSGAAEQARAQTVHDQIVGEMYGIRNAPEPQKPALWSSFRSRVVGNKLIAPDEIPEQYPGDAEIDAQARGLLDLKSQWEQANQKQPEGFTLGEGQQRFGPDGKVIASGPPKPESVKEPQTYEVVVRGPNGRPVKKLVTKEQLMAGVEQYEKPDATTADVTSLTPQGLDAAAMMFAKTGQLPALGMGDKTTRKEIINRAAALMPGLDVASAKADFTANQQSLSALQKQRDAISAFEQTASKNIDIFLAQAGKVVDTGSPLTNTAARFVTGKMLGAPDQAAYDAARQVAVNEIAKITGNPNLTGTLSDAARHEVESFNPRNATLGQTVAVMRILKQDMANRAASMDDQLAAIRDRVKTASTPQQPAATPAPTQPTKTKIGRFDVEVH